MAAGGTRRVYFALWPDPAQQVELAEAAQAAVAESQGRVIPAGNLHVTLAFLGSVPQARLADVSAVGARVAAETSASEARLSFTGLECWKRAGVLCAVTKEDDPVATAVSTGLKRQLVAAGFAPDLKPFRPHVTLSRKVHITGEKARTGQDAPLAAAPVVWTFAAFALVDSRTEVEGAIYTVLDSFRIGR
jgi:RNA 2',3'-cyclic 3'-phosphodiesterase